MQLTQYTDYALRALIALAVARPQKLTVAQISSAYRISRNHLVKVVVKLSDKGYVVTTRGKGGGITLSHEPSRIRVGDVVRDMEATLGVVECLKEEGGHCVIVPACRLKGVLQGATRRFLDELDAWTLEDLLVERRESVGTLLGIAVVTVPVSGA